MVQSHSRVRPAPPRHRGSARRWRQRCGCGSAGLRPAERRPFHAAVGVVHPRRVRAAAAATEQERSPLEQPPPPPVGAQPLHLRLQRVALHLEPGDVLAEATELVVLRDDLALGRAPGSGGGRGGEIEGAGAPVLQGAEGTAPVGEAAELAAVLGEEHLDHAAHRKAIVLHSVRRRLRRQLARVDQPAQRPALLLARVRVRLHVTRVTTITNGTPSATCVSPTYYSSQVSPTMCKDR